MKMNVKRDFLARIVPKNAIVHMHWVALMSQEIVFVILDGLVQLVRRRVLMAIMGVAVHKGALVVIGGHVIM